MNQERKITIADEKASIPLLYATATTTLSSYLVSDCTTENRTLDPGPGPGSSALISCQSSVHMLHAVSCRHSQLATTPQSYLVSSPLPLPQCPVHLPSWNCASSSRLHSTALCPIAAFLLQQCCSCGGNSKQWQHSRFQGEAPHYTIFLPIAIRNAMTKETWRRKGLFGFSPLQSVTWGS